MAAVKSTTGMGKEHEEHIVELLSWDNARRSRSSGASAHDPIDVTSDSLVVECEATENKSYSLKKSFWDEIMRKQHSGKLPALAIRFRDPHGPNDDLMIMKAADIASLLEEVEAYRKDSLDRG
jgi:hypothetical protein